MVRRVDRVRALAGQLELPADRAAAALRRARSASRKGSGQRCWWRSIRVMLLNRFTEPLQQYTSSATAPTPARCQTWRAELRPRSEAAAARDAPRPGAQRYGSVRGHAEARHHQGRRRGDRPVTRGRLLRAARGADVAGDAGARARGRRGARLHGQRGRPRARPRPHGPRRRPLRLAGGPRASSASSRCSAASSARRDLHMVVVDARGEPERERMLARQLADQLVDGLSSRRSTRPTPRGRRSARRCRS